MASGSSFILSSNNPSGHRNLSGRPVELKQLLIVKRSIGSDWKDLGRLFGLKDSLLDELHHSTEKYDVPDIAYKMLREWEKSQNSIKSVGTLIEHLQDLQRTDIAEDILRSVNAVAVNSPSGTETDDVIEDFIFMETSPRGVIGYERERRQRECKLFAAKNALLPFYRKLTIPRLPWITGSFPFTNYVAPRFVFSKATQNNDSMSNESSFTRFLKCFCDESSPIKLLVEGTAGSGKTTLAAKLCYDWSENRIPFDMVLLLPLRKFIGNFYQLVSAAPGFINAGVELHDIVHDKSKKMLFVLDGYDEILDDNHRQELLRQLTSDALSHVSMLVTSRPQNLWEEKPHFWNEKVTIMDLDVDQKNTILHHYKQTPEFHSINCQLPEELNNCWLLMLSFSLSAPMLEEVLGEETLTKVPMLYTCVFNDVLHKYSFFKQNRTKKESKPLNCSTDTPIQLWQQIVDLGEAVLDAIGKNSFASVDLKMFLTAGFFGQTAAEERLYDDGVHEPLHRTILEFAAAYGLYVMSGMSTCLHGTWINKVKMFKPKEIHFSSLLVIPFLRELLTDEVSKLLEALDMDEDEYNKVFCTHDYKLLDTQESASSSKIKSSNQRRRTAMFKISGYHNASNLLNHEERKKEQEKHTKTRRPRLVLRH